MGEDTKKPDPQSTTTPSSQEPQKKKEETTQDSPPAPSTETVAHEKDDETTPTNPTQQAATTPGTPQAPNNYPTATPSSDPPQPPNGDTKQGEDQGKSWVDVIKDSVTILGGSTVVIVALFVFAGRRYAEGYFNALHIPIFSISFSIWDYSEIGFLILILVIIVILLLIVILSFLKIAIDMGFVFVRQKFQYRSRKHINIFPQVPKESISPLLSSIKNLIISWFILAILMIFMGPIVAVSLVAYDFGERQGYQYTQEGAIGVSLTSKEPFLIPAPIVTAATATANEEPTYTYGGLYLLTDNDGSYFLFDDVDETCRPRDIYIVKEAQLLSVQFLPTQPFSKSCSTPIPADISPTLTVIPTTAPTPTPTSQATPMP